MINYQDTIDQLESSATKEIKKQQGVIYTPQFIVDYILDKVLENCNANTTILDPSCGGGIFLIGAAKKLNKKTGKAIKDIISENLFGIDCDSEAVKTTKKILQNYCGVKSKHIYCGNSTDKKFLDKLDKRFDVVIGNPPYVRLQNIPEKQRKYLNNWDYVAGDSDMYIAFIQLGLYLLKENGLLGYITANSFLKNKSTEGMLGDLLNGKIKEIIDFEGAQIFGKKAMTYTSILIATQKAQTFDKITIKKTTPAFLDELAHSTPDMSKLVSDVKSYSQINIKNLLIHSSKDSLIRKLEETGKKLKDIAKIRVGLATLADKVFFIDKIDAKHLESDILKPCVKVSKLKTESDINAIKKFIIYPYHIEGKQAISYTEKEMKELFPNAYNYLLRHKNRLLERDCGKKMGYKWWEYGRTQGLMSLFGKKLFMPPMVKEPIFIMCENKKLLYLSGYAIFSDVRLDVIKCCLESDLFKEYVLLTGKDFHGGWKACSKHSVEQFSIPDIADYEIDELKNNTDKFLQKKYGL